jgi:NAD-dependent dihydropyrimidine dehydrogenase PreA subunit
MEKGNQDSCRQAPGIVRPVVDPARCEGKAACVEVCPMDVFEIVRIPAETFQTLPWLAQIKVRAHGMKTAATPNAAACESCGLCVSACPERAIRLERVQSTSNASGL